MKSFAIVMILGIIAASAAPVASLAQGPVTNPTAPVTGMKPDRTTADPSARQHMQRREAVLRQKRAACRSEAREQRISIFKRRSFMRRCMGR